MRISEYPLVQDLVVDNIFLLDGASGTKTILASDFAQAIFSMLDEMGYEFGVDFDKLQKTVSLTDSSVFLVGEASGKKKISPKDAFYAIFDKMTTVEGRRGIFRSKNLGSTFTAQQSLSIKNGTFDGMFLGDYWVMNDVPRTGEKTRVIITDLDYRSWIDSSWNSVYHNVMLMTFGENNGGFTMPSSLLSYVNFDRLSYNTTASSLYNIYKNGMLALFDGAESTTIPTAVWADEARNINSTSTSISSIGFTSEKVYIPCAKMITDVLPIDSSMDYAFSANWLNRLHNYPKLAYFDYVMRDSVGEDPRTLDSGNPIPAYGTGILLSDNIKYRSIALLKPDVNSAKHYTIEYITQGSASQQISKNIVLWPMMQIRGNEKVSLKKGS